MLKQSQSLETLKEDFKKHRNEIIEHYLTFLRFQSVSSEPQYKDQVIACAEWLISDLKKMGFDVELWPTEGHPIIFASHLKAGSEQPTLLIYNHYDVQPVDPIEEWISPPFEPTIRNGEVYARGAQDNKGQCCYVIQALKALMRRDGSLPINIKLCIEGEEEMGSHSLSKILPQKKAPLKADYLAIVDMGLQQAHSPAVTLGIRGLVTMDIEIQDSRIDLHSGSHGGIVYNPIHALVELLSKLRDSTSGQIVVPGFYDDVKEVKESEKAQLSLNFDETKYNTEFGTKPLGGELDFSPLERAWIRPTIEINGITGGYTGHGFKTVIPAKASAKLSCRLVPHQNPIKIGNLVAQYLKDNTPEGLKTKVVIHQGCGMPVRAFIDSEVVQAFSKAYTEVFKLPCEYIFSGGSIPIATELTQTSESEVILLGMGLPTDQIHAPNEHFGLDRLETGFLVMSRAIELLTREKS
jgi:acetylornithine deacetylase/succinyl-diaminopimelate desuccinylase-like protein